MLVKHLVIPFLISLAAAAVVYWLGAFEHPNAAAMRVVAATPASTPADVAAVPEVRAAAEARSVTEAPAPTTKPAEATAPALQPAPTTFGAPPAQTQAAALPPAPPAPLPPQPASLNPRLAAPVAQIAPPPPPAFDEPQAPQQTQYETIPTDAAMLPAPMPLPMDGPGMPDAPAQIDPAQEAAHAAALEQQALLQAQQDPNVAQQ